MWFEDLKFDIIATHHAVVVRQPLSMESLGLEAGLEFNTHCLGGFVWLGFGFPPFPVPGTQAVQAGQSCPGLAVLPAGGGGLGALLPAEPVLSLLRVVPLEEPGWPLPGTLLRWQPTLSEQLILLFYHFWQWACLSSRRCFMT